LRSYAFAIPIVAFNRIPYALAFAQNKSRELLIYAVIFALTLIGSEVLLISIGIGMPAFGVAQIIALTTSTIWLYPRVMRGLDSPAWSADEVLRLLGVGLVALTGTMVVVYISQELVLDPTLSVWAAVLAGCSSSLLLTAGAAWLLRLPEVAGFSRLLRGASQ
jgi:hypothetical protein